MRVHTDFARPARSAACERIAETAYRDAGMVMEIAAGKRVTAAASEVPGPTRSVFILAVNLTKATDSAIETGGIVVKYLSLFEVQEAGEKGRKRFHSAFPVAIITQPVILVSLMCRLLTSRLTLLRAFAARASLRADRGALLS